MTDQRFDPRHSPSFQRGFEGSVIPAGSRSPSESSARQPYTPPSLESFRRSDPAAEAVSLTPHTESDRPDPVLPDDVDSSGDFEREAAESERREADARRRFRIWTISLVAIGAGLIALSIWFYSSSWDSRYYSFTSDADGTFTVETSEGREQVDGMTIMLAQYRSQLSTWVALVGVGTIVGALFRAAGRR